MTPKLSPYKLSKMLSLYFHGYPQVEIANKLNISQAIVSIHVDKFKALAEQEGLKIAGEEYGIMDEIEGLHSLAAELKEAKLTTEEAKVGLKMELLFAKCGIKPEDCGDLIQACTQMKAEGFINAAVKLNQLGNSTGITYEEIAAQAASTYQQLKEAQQNLKSVMGNLNASKEALANIDTQKKLAEDDLKAHMQQIGVNEERLKKVETLAMALKDEAIPNQELSSYIIRQESLNKAGITLNIFTEMLKKVKVATKEDHGGKLLNLLSEYSGLAGVISEYQDKKRVLTKVVGDLEQKVKTKDKLTSEINIQTDVRSKLETEVDQLQKDKNKLDNVTGLLQIAQAYNKKLNDENAKFEHEIIEKQATRDSLENEIDTKEQKVADLLTLESQRVTLLNDISEMDARVEKDKKRWQAFEGFLGLVLAKSKDELRESYEIFSSKLGEIDNKKYSLDSLRDQILKDFVPALQVLKCQNCQALIYIDKPLEVVTLYGNYRCPSGDIDHEVVVAKDASAILRKALAKPKPKEVTSINVKNISIIAQAPPTDKGNT